MSDDFSPIYSSIASDEDIREILTLFVEEMPQRIAVFQSALDAKNRAALKVAAHQFKGAAGSHGFKSLSEAAQNLEEAIKADQPDEQITSVSRHLMEMCSRATATPEP